jgi:glycosyltransferase involved in cell wall biosynthesis
MKPVAIVTGDFVPTGGMDRANYALASYLARNGRPVELVAHRATADLLRRPEVTLHRVAKPCNSYFLGHWLLAARGRRVARRVAQTGGRVIVNGGNCGFGDVNWVHYVHAAYEPQIAASPLRRCKSRIDRPLQLRDERRAVRAARLVICNSRRTQRDVVELLGIPEERTRVVYYGNDPGEFYPADPEAKAELRRRLSLPSDRPLAVFVGALGDRRKGFDTVYAAWEQLCRDKSWDADLIVVGAGAELPLWRKRTSEAGLDRRIHYLGFRTDVPDILRACDVLVAPTRYEAYGLGVQEALCCGLPAIVSSSAGVAERFSGTLCQRLLKNPSDFGELIMALRHWADSDGHDHPELSHFATCLRNYSWDDMCNSMLAAIGIPQVASSNA